MCPIHDMHFQDGIFFAREEGMVNEAEAKAWAEKLREFAASSPTPIVVLVDALKVTSVTRKAGDIFAAAARTPNLLVSVVATKDVVVSQVARVISLKGNRGETLLFPTLDEARAFAEGQAAMGRDSL